jgi:hypothetical protein
MTYTMLAFLNHSQRMPTKGELFEYLSDKAAEITTMTCIGHNEE